MRRLSTIGARRAAGVLAVAALVAAAVGGTSQAAPLGVHHCSVDTVIYTNGILGEHDGGCYVDTGSDGTPNGKSTTAAPYIGISAPHTITAGKPFTFTITPKKPLCKAGLALKELCVEAWNGGFRNIDAGRSMPLTAATSKPSEACAGQNYGDKTGAQEDNRTLTCRAVVSRSAVAAVAGPHAQWALEATVTMFGPGGGSAGAELEVPVVIDA